MKDREGRRTASAGKRDNRIRPLYNSGSLHQLLNLLLRKKETKRKGSIRTPCSSTFEEGTEKRIKYDRISWDIILIINAETF